MNRIVRWWRGRRGWRADLERQVEEEIRLHLDLRASALQGRGMTEPEARADAIRRFGRGVGTRSGLFAAAMKRERRMRIRSWLDGLRQDAGYAMRAAIREPAISIVIVVTLALGVGANATMFGLIDQLLLRGPAHVESDDDVYRFYMTGRRTVDSSEWTTDGLGYVSYVTFRDGTRTFDGVAAYRRVDGRVGQGATAESAGVGAATADFFPLLGVRAHLGRFHNEAEDRPPTGQNVVVLGYDFWRRRFGADRGVLGESVIVNDQSFTVIGVAPPGFTGVELSRVDVWIPMSADSRGVTRDWPESWTAQWLRVVGRLKPGVSPEQADLDATAAHRAAYTGPSRGLQEARTSIRPILYNREGREPLEVVVTRWLLAVASIVLLIACANVTNLLLARSTRRRREIAVRRAMGIGRGRLFRMLVMHGLALAAAGGVLGLLIVGTAGPVTRTVLYPDVAWSGAPVDAHVLLFTAGVVLMVAAFTSVIPAFRAGRQDLTRGLKSGVREGGGRRSALRTGLTVAQVTLTFVLLVGAGLFARSLSNVRSIDLGIEPDRVLALSVNWATPASSAEPGTEEAQQANIRRRATYYARALDRVRAHPGVAEAAVAVGTPFRSSFTVDVRASGHDSIPAMAGGGPYISAVTDGFFETTGIDLTEGRVFSASDTEGSEPVAIVNRTMAQALWSGAALGKCLYLIEDDPGAPCSRVVGVVGVAHRFGLREPPAMQYYIPKGQERGFGGDVLLVRPAGRAGDPDLIADLRTALIELDPGLSFVRASSMQDEIDPQVRPWKLGTTLFSLFGGLALLIAVIGLYSVIAYMVADRTHELGVRKALGADRGAVLMLVLRHSFGLVAVGLVFGALISLLAGRLVESALFEISARDPTVFIWVGVLTLAASGVASLVPAWRAGRVDPVTALRAD